jgi:chaperone modulatory protein CbpM
MTISRDELLVRVARITEVRLERWVGLGWVRPDGQGEEARFAEVDVARCELICDLVDDLGIDEEAMPVVLGLMDQVYGLRRELKVLTEAIESQPADVRIAVLDMLARARTPSTWGG